MELLGVQRHNVPHFKGLISGNFDFEAQGLDSTFTFLYSLLKKAILLHKRAIGPMPIKNIIENSFGREIQTRSLAKKIHLY